MIRYEKAVSLLVDIAKGEAAPAAQKDETPETEDSEPDSEPEGGDDADDAKA